MANVARALAAAAVRAYRCPHGLTAWHPVAVRRPIGTLRPIEPTYRPHVLRCVVDHPHVTHRTARVGGQVWT